MARGDDIGEDEYGVDSSTSSRYRCEECGYKWNVSGYNEESNDDDKDTVYYDGNEGLDPTTCPMCGCSDILSL